jgi:hypothetical protein
MAEVAATGNLRGKPAIIVHGRSDTLIPVNFASRAYVGLNATAEGSASKLRYIEVTNANHFDSFSSVLPANIVPLHVYLFRALDAMLANLRSSTALPPSQVVRTVTRVDNTTLITNANLPPIAAAPPAATPSRSRRHGGGAGLKRGRVDRPRIVARDGAGVIPQQAGLEHGVVGQPVQIRFRDAHLLQRPLYPRHDGDLLHGNSQRFRPRLDAAAGGRHHNLRQLGVQPAASAH